MHFSTTVNQLQFIYDSLRPGGSFSFNYYIKDKQIDHFIKLVDALNHIGFKTTYYDKDIFSPMDDMQKTQTFVIATKQK